MTKENLRVENSVSDIDKKVGQKIRKARLNLGLSLKDLSIKTGFSISMLSALELGNRRICIDTLYALADALNLDAKDLLVSSKKETMIADKQLDNIINKWQQDSRKNEVIILLHEFLDLTPEQIQALLKTVKVFKSI